jgi:hypothetical protein
LLGRGRVDGGCAGELAAAASAAGRGVDCLLDPMPSARRRLPDTAFATGSSPAPCPVDHKDRGCEASREAL